MINIEHQPNEKKLPTLFQPIPTVIPANTPKAKVGIMSLLSMTQKIKKLLNRLSYGLYFRGRIHKKST
jgi:hypothetical protein